MVRREDLSFSEVAGHHLVVQQPEERVITQGNIRRFYSFRDYEKNGCFVIYVGKQIMAIRRRKMRSYNFINAAAA